MFGWRSLLVGVGETFGESIQESPPARGKHVDGDARVVISDQSLIEARSVTNDFVLGYQCLLVGVPRY